MAMTPGTRLGPYEVLSLLGAGGMGEVYRGRDTKLNRDVAIKVLPELFATDTERLSRFTREAQVLASLNHPNIAHVYGIENNALVMELVEGQDLSVLIAAGPIALDDTLSIAKQIADALEAAHEHGIIHRDLKPANIKVREDGVVKVLDFGLAKAMDPGGTSGASVANSPTITARATQMGMILGTAAYMSPEQAKGKAVDKRADIWAFGAVLYEMLTGSRAFKGDDVTETLASVLKDHADLAALPGTVPLRLRSLIARCLERDVKLRLRDIGEARVELAKITDHPELPASQPAATVTAATPTRMPWVVAAMAIAVAAVAGWSALGSRPAPTSAPPMHMRLNIDPAEALLGSEPAETRIGSRRPSRTAIALSSDGRWLAFTGIQKGTQQLFLRDLSREAGVAVAGTTGADNPFFSPDDKWIGFWSGGALRKVPVDGGPVSEICKTTRISGADWGKDGRILFGAESAISVVSGDGGAPSIVAKLDAASDDEFLRLPRWIDSSHFLYTVLNSREAIRSRLEVQRFDGSGKRVLMDDATDGRIVAGGSHLVFMRKATLMAAPFDVATASVTGASQGMVDGVQVSLNSPNTAIEVGAGEFAVSDSGTLVYLPGQMFSDSQAVFTWVDRKGQASPLEMDHRSYSAPRLSPDNHRAVSFTIGNDRAIWIHDFQRRSTRKVRFDGITGRVIWTPDGKSIVFGGQTAKDRGLYRMPADGSGTAEHLPGGVRSPSPLGWSRDGTELVYVELVREADGGNGSYDIFGVTLATGKIRPIVQTDASETHAAVSPDGRWLAYVSNETSRFEVLVQPYDGGGRVDVSVGGGTAPRWTHDGKTLIYTKQIPDPKNSDRVRFELWEVPMMIDATIKAGTPRRFGELSQEEFGTASPTSNYDVAIDGRILGTTRVLVTPPPPAILNVITNWLGELRSKVSK